MTKFQTISRTTINLSSLICTMAPPVTHQSVESGPHLQSVCGSTPWMLLHCPRPECCNLATSYKLSTTYEWAIQLSCSKCPSEKWYVCSNPACNLRKRLSSPSQMRLHNKRYHSEHPSNPRKKSSAMSCHESRRDTQEMSVIADDCNKPPHNHNCNNDSAFLESTSEEKDSLDAFIQQHPIEEKEGNEDNDGSFPSNNTTPNHPSSVAHQIERPNQSCKLPTYDSPQNNGDHPNSPIQGLHLSYNNEETYMMHFHSTATRTFFHFLKQKSSLGYLVGLSYFGLSNVSKEISDESLNMYLRYAFLLKKLPHSLRMDLVRFTHDYQRYMSGSDSSKGSSNCEETNAFHSIKPLPFTNQDIRRKFFKGSNAFFQSSSTNHLSI